MYTPREKILWFSITSRLAVIFLQVISNALTPDHTADAFRTPPNPQEVPNVYDKAVNFLLGGLTRWDSQYYVHIARHGYTYENTLAFLPLYPMSIRTLAAMLRRMFFFLGEPSVVVIAAVAINFVCFVKSSLVFYDLSRHVLGASVGYRAAVLYCVSPAGIFLTAAYTESMFAYLAFSSMLAAVKTSPFASLPVGLSALVRSNGLVNLGFPVYVWLQDFISKASMLRRNLKKRSVASLVLGLKVLLGSALGLLKTVLLSITPFLLLQTYNYVLFCTESMKMAATPHHVARYGRANGLVMPGKTIPPWCHYSVPSAYSYIQEKYWNVGFMNYYEFKQIPNFVLAGPVIFMMLKCIFEFCSENRSVIFSVKVLTLKFDNSEKKLYPAEMFPFIVHGLFLTIFCILFVHIQVSTRLLASASPLIYWYAAILMSRGGDDFEGKNNMRCRWRVFFMSQKIYTRAEKLVLGYFLGYTIVGTFMFSNFLPWT